MRIRKVGVVGAGTMGSGIAALCASAGIPVVLLDVAGKETDRAEPAKRGIDRALKAKPAAFMDPDRARAIVTGTIDDDLARLGDCDLVIEAIVEQLEPKRALYARLESLAPDAIVASNTSGIPMRALIDGRGERFQRRFLGTHFFNPPRYLHLLEIIPAPDTEPAVLDAVRAFGDRILGKGIVIANDVPGFIANRLGVYGMVLAMRLMERHRLTIDDVDVLTGTLTARSKSATFRTADLSGLDVISHVTEELGRATGEDLSLPSWVRALIDAGRYGEKTGAGFYMKSRDAGRGTRDGGSKIQTLDWATGEYRPQAKIESPDIARLHAMDLEHRFAALRDWKGPYGEFVREYLLRFSHYVLSTAPVIAPDAGSVDRAMEWGYAWEIGPIAQMHLLGADFLRDGFRRLGLDEPAMLADLTAAAANAKTAGPPRLANRPTRDRLASNDDATLWNMDGVAVLEFHSKANTIGRGVLDMLVRSLDEVERRDELAGLVIGNDDPRTFSGGANLAMVAELVTRGDWAAMDAAVREFQGIAMRFRAVPFPVVAAPFGVTLGGACEMVLQTDQIQAHAELYMGQVEVAVGLLPAGGGCKELLFRFTSELASYPEADPFDAVRRAFQLIAMGTTSSSALEARNLGLLRASDRITMNRDRLIEDAIRRVRDLATDYVSPLPRTMTALGKDALGNLDYAAWAMREAGQISVFEVSLAHEVAYVLTGGDGPPRTVTEQDILDLERDAFLRLLGTKETKERIEALLKTGKPVRN